MNRPTAYDALLDQRRQSSQAPASRYYETTQRRHGEPGTLTALGVECQRAAWLERRAGAYRGMRS